MEIVLDGIRPSSFGGTSWSFPAMNVRVEWFMTSAQTFTAEKDQD